MAQPDPRLADPLLLVLAAQRARARKAPPVPVREVPPGWWGEFVRVCCRELPADGIDMLVRLGFPEAEIQSLRAMPEAAFTAWQACVP